MRRVKVVNQETVRKDYSRILRPLEGRVREIVVNILEGVETGLAQKLHGIGLEVMRAVMECEREEVVGVKGKHNPDRQYIRGGSNPGSVVIDRAKVACRIPRAREVVSGVEYELKSHSLFQQAGDLVRRAYRDLIRGISTRRCAEGVESFVKGYGISAASTPLFEVVACFRPSVKVLPLDPGCPTLEIRRWYLRFSGRSLDVNIVPHTIEPLQH